MRHRDDRGFDTIAEALSDSLVVEELRGLAALLESSLPTRKAELIRVILHHMQRDGSLVALWERLDELQRAAVSEVVHGSGARFDADRFRAKYGRDPDWGSLDRYNRKNKPALLHLFLYESEWMPDELKERLKTFVPRPRKVTLESADEIPELHKRPWEHYNYRTKESTRGVEEIPIERRDMERAAQHDLRAVLGLVGAGKVSVSDKTRLPTGAAVKAVRKLLQEGDFYTDVSKWDEVSGDREDWEDVGDIRAFAWPLIVQAAGFAQLSGKRLQLTQAGKRAIANPVEEALRTAWKRWLDAKLLDELRRIDCIKGQTGRGGRNLTAVGGRRSAIASALVECPVGRWVEVDEFFRYMRASGHHFEVSHDPWRLYVANRQYGSLGYSGSGGWKILQARYALCLLFEYAATMGLIDVAYVLPAGVRPDYGDMWGTDDLPFFSRYDGLVYFRLTALGAYCLGVTDEYTPAIPEPAQVLKVLPNLEVAAVGRLDPGDRFTLDLYARQQSDAVWRLDRGRLLEALEAGHRVAEFCEFLEARSAEELPEAASRFLAETQERAGRIRDAGQAWLIECSDPELAALIARDSRTKQHCLLAGERHVAVTAGSENAFKRALNTLGYCISPDAGTLARKAVGTLAKQRGSRKKAKK